jgi:hypothetical protein
MIHHRGTVDTEEGKEEELATKNTKRHERKR